MSIFTKSPNAFYHQKQRWQRSRQAVWLLVAFAWFGILVPYLHHSVINAAVFRSAQNGQRQPANHGQFRTGATAETLPGEDRLQRDSGTVFSDCLLCEWLASAPYAAAGSPRYHLSCSQTDAQPVLTFRLTALCARGVPCRIPRAPPVSPSPRLIRRDSPLSSPDITTPFC